MPATPTLFLALALQSGNALPPPPHEIAPLQPTARVAAPVATPVGTPGMTLDQARLVQCQQAIEADPTEAVLSAGEWVGAAPQNAYAQQCLGLSYNSQQEFASAATAFAAGARLATQDAVQAAKLWASAGTAALAANATTDARRYLDNALTAGVLTGRDLRNAYVDRARAAVAAVDVATARSDLDAAMPLSSDDPTAWILSATLHRRQNELEAAQSDIQQAAAIAPRDAAVALEAGNIAARAGNLTVARASWQSAVTIAGNTPIGATARGHLTQLDAFEREEGATPAASPAAPAPTPQAPPPHSR